MTAHPAPAHHDQPRGSAVRAAAWMLVLSLLLFWLPLIGPLVAGFVGGRIAGSPGKAAAVALLPAVVLGLLVALILIAFDLELLGSIAGVGVGVAVLVEDIPLIAGAVVGGALD